MSKIKSIKLFIMILRPFCTSGPLWPSGAFKSVTLILIGISFVFDITGIMDEISR